MATGKINDRSQSLNIPSRTFIQMNGCYSTNSLYVNSLLRIQNSFFFKLKKTQGDTFYQ